MQTFLPYPNFQKSAEVLDWRRLGKQRVETKQIYQILTGVTTANYHPAWVQWKGCEKLLLVYGIIMCNEWIRRGYQDSLRPYFLEKLKDHKGEPFKFPDFLGNENFHLAHRVRLIQKDDEYYWPKFPNTPEEFPYEDYYYGAPYSRNRPRRSEGIDSSRVVSS